MTGLLPISRRPFGVGDFRIFRVVAARSSCGLPFARVRWFVEEIGGLTVISRVDVEAGIFQFTYDGGRTWRFGDRSLGYRAQGSLDVEEISEAEALRLLD